MKVILLWQLFLTASLCFVCAIDAARSPRDKSAVRNATNTAAVQRTRSRSVAAAAIAQSTVVGSSTTVATPTKSGSKTGKTGRKSTTTAPTKKNHPGKKYRPDEQKKSQPTTTNSNIKPKREEPTKIILPIQAQAADRTLIPVEDPLTCPKETEAEFNLFAIKCQTHKECTSWHKGERCCNLFGAKSCTKGVPQPIKEQKHSPIFGLIPRKCPERTLAELWWELKTCETDDDCWPRVCCPDGRNKYCRTSKPHLEAMPLPIGRSITYLSEYLECTPPPPPVFDLHPKPCNSTFDCFPNVCCQESGKKHCRPPKKSVLTLMANFLNVGLVKRLTNNLVIK